MIGSNCSMKLLEKAYVGVHVRMTGGDGTVKFDNVPMKDVRILSYDEKGFWVNHPSLPRKTLIDFKQLPLLTLTIVNGVIQDEITFVENILNHSMEFIKTDMLDYIELVDIRNRESQKEYHSVSDLKPGDVVKSALCNNGREMTYLGTFYVKEVNARWRYTSNEGYTYSVDDNLPRRVFFAVPQKGLTHAERGTIAMRVGYNDKMRNCYNTGPNKGMSDAEMRRRTREFDNACSELEDQKGRFTVKIESYPVTSKVIKNVEKVGINDARFSDTKENIPLALNALNIRYSYDGSRNSKMTRIKEYEAVLTKDVKCVNRSYGSTYTCFISEKKEPMDSIISIIEQEYGIKIKRG